MTLSLALRWLAQPGQPVNTEADDFARDLVETTLELDRERIKTAEQAKRINALVHEVERLRAQPPTRIWPVHIRCDGKCGAVVAFDPAPEEADMAKALLELGWCLSRSGEHHCSRCGR